ncbi:Outer membrane protein TolC [Aquiflexum balticum DSM 16537]|uniref:Outer membrane protein TolC n=1 Tax=Aquiflexum balticum DSM 16537 TaxID=758820 RepID=A0A1W2H9T1_9BACT|nr:TolC family protein [Aquiflexum balticum]SMD45643.1 Outer membrane protein TolC [Aquiflexum balticum DSM 16537]
MKKSIILYTLLLLTFVNANGQSSFDVIMAEIEKNNKTLQANAQKQEAQNLQFKSEMPLYNPDIGYDFMYGFPLNAGNQTDILLNQTFDFPTVYGKRKQLANEQIAQSTYNFDAARQEVLFEAQSICIELVYRNKLHEQFQLRKTFTENLLSDFETKLETGDGNILDVNKARLQLIEINKEFQLNLSEINQLNQQLTALNGGIEIAFTETIYPEMDPIPFFEDLYLEIQSEDPTLKFIEMETVTAKKQLELSKAMALPKMEAGYRYQGILGQTFNGFHIGTSIPLWENKYKVRQSEAAVLFSDLRVREYQNEKFYDVKQLFEKYEKLSRTFNEYKTVLSAINSLEYLDKALEVGHISTIVYFMESNYYYMAYNNFLLTEKDYYAVKAEILKFRL